MSWSPLNPLDFGWKPVEGSGGTTVQRCMELPPDRENPGAYIVRIEICGIRRLTEALIAERHGWSMI